MTSKENRADVSHYAVAIARWDDDGGAFMSAPGNMGARPSNGGDSRRIAESPAVLKSDRSSGDDRKILECLGAAVIMQWGTLPTKIQRDLFERAVSLAGLGHTAPPKGQIARFLHNHRDDGDRTPRRVIL